MGSFDSSSFLEIDKEIVRCVEILNAILYLCSSQLSSSFLSTQNILSGRALCLQERLRAEEVCEEQLTRWRKWSGSFIDRSQLLVKYTSRSSNNPKELCASRRVDYSPFLALASCTAPVPADSFQPNLLKSAFNSFSSALKS